MTPAAPLQAPPAHAGAPASMPAPTAAPVAGTGTDLLALAGMPAAEVRALLTRARTYAMVATTPRTRTTDLAGAAVATLFFEDSTRTKTSFALAARRLGADVVDLAVGASSVNKGETIVDTARNLEAMGVSAMVVRARQSGAAAAVAAAVACPVLNAGDGRHEHPTQGLLDAYTIAEAHRRLDGMDLSGLTVGIVGDLASSRVCRSNVACLTALGARVVLVGPTNLAPAGLRSVAADPAMVTIEHALDPVLEGLDAVMMLRVQFERHGESGDAKAEPGRASAAIPSVREYRAVYGLTRERARRLRPGCVVMHPGPMNRGLEIDGEVADGERSVILTQVSRGVAVRMACLSRCVGAG